MKKNVWIVCALFVSIFAVSCSSDDDNTSVLDGVELTGSWQLKSVHLTKIDEETMPPDGCFVSYVAGYKFIDDPEKPMKVKLTDSFPKQIPDGDFWNWSGDIHDFETVQNNPTMPYDFALHPEDIKLKEVNGQVQMTFNEKLDNGSEGEFTLVKQDIETSQEPKVTEPDGSDYVCHLFDGRGPASEE